MIGRLILPQSAPKQLGRVTGSGTTNYIPKFTASTTIGNSIIIEDAGNIGIGGSPVTNFQVISSSGPTIAFKNTTSNTSLTRGDIQWYNSSTSTVAQINALATTDDVGTSMEFKTRGVAGSLTKQLDIGASGAIVATSSVTASSLIKSGGTSSQALIADGSVTTLTNGTYTPSATNISNTSAITTYASQYLRVGNTVTVSGFIEGTSTASANNEFEITLPVASALTAAYQLAGTAVTTQSGAPSFSSPIRAGVANDKASFAWYTVSTGFAFYYTFTYQVL